MKKLVLSAILAASAVTANADYTADHMVKKVGTSNALGAISLAFVGNLNHNCAGHQKWGIIRVFQMNPSTGQLEVDVQGAFNWDAAYRSWEQYISGNTHSVNVFLSGECYGNLPVIDRIHLGQ